MQSRNDDPNINNFNFGTESVFNNIQVIKSNSTPILPNSFLLLNTMPLLLLDGTNFLLLGT
jgi:hypothetical protein